MKRPHRWMIALSLTAAACAERATPGPMDGRSNSDPSSPSVRGIALLHVQVGSEDTGYGSPSSARSLAQARALGVNAISLRVPGRQPDISTPAIRFSSEPPDGESDPAIVQTIRQAKELGMRVMLKPHIMLDRITATEWRARIDFTVSSDLERWWSDYRAFLMHTARLAEDEDVEFLAVGVELMDMVLRTPDRWERLIEELRTVYSGRLTYAANWDQEFEKIPFWSSLDLVAVQFFFPLSADPNPSADTLERSLKPISERLFRVARKHGRPLLLTECGYRSVLGATVRPWTWPKDDPNAVVNVELQARVYAVILDHFSKQPGFAGLFWWNWLTLPHPGSMAGPLFTPQGKPAQEVLRKRWSPSASPRSPGSSSRPTDG